MITYYLCNVLRAKQAIGNGFIYVASTYLRAPCREDNKVVDKIVTSDSLTLICCLKRQSHNNYMLTIVKFP